MSLEAVKVEKECLVTAEEKVKVVEHACGRTLKPLDDMKAVFKSVGKGITMRWLPHHELLLKKALLEAQKLCPEARGKIRAIMAVRDMDGT